jgi:NAD(P)-dependent dehydrogenase (short-subunit alcohol dehydrogenase family)
MRSAFITGAVTGIGEALVLRLRREGWQVFACVSEQLARPNTAEMFASFSYVTATRR